MTFKLPNQIPSERASAQEWADYAEYNALVNKSVNLHQLTKASQLVSDEEIVEGVEDESDKFLNKIDDICKEIRTRMSIAAKHYPYSLTNMDYVLEYVPASDHGNIIYPYLLLATRARMSIDRIKSELDGSLLFEHLCAAVAKEYFGDRSNVDVFGTSKKDFKTFREKLQDIAKIIGEGGQIHLRPNYRPKDDNVDVIIWKGFADKQPSQMIAFGQCKTGTNWTEKISELNTQAFCNRWFTDQPVLLPIRMFFTAQDFPRNIFLERAQNAGLVFDRFRILDYLPQSIEEDLLKDLKIWSSAILDFYRN